MILILLLRVIIIGRAPRGNERGAMGSQSPPTYQNPCFSLLGMVHGSKNPGSVLRPLSPICRCLVGRCFGDMYTFCLQTIFYVQVKECANASGAR